MLKPINYPILLFVLLVFVSCRKEDPGALQQAAREYNIGEFSRINMGSAFHVHVNQGAEFTISAEGDRRNLDDLEVYKSGNTLIIKYKNHANRKHKTNFDITLPVLEGVDFHGASESVISGFENQEGVMDISLSGASTGKYYTSAGQMKIKLSGASKLSISGAGNSLHAEVSGASNLDAFDYPVNEAILNASGASSCKITVSQFLDATASGASSVIYAGSPEVISNSSGSSVIRQQ